MGLQTVLIVHNRYRKRGGEDTVVGNEKKLLTEHGHKVYLYVRDNAEIGTYGIPGKLALAVKTLFNPRTYLDVRKVIREKHIDVVHVHNTLPLISPAVYYAAVSAGVPVVQTVHNFRLICPDALLYRKGHICEDCIKKGLRCAVQHGCYRDSRLQTLLCVINTKLHRMTGIYSKVNYICLTEFNRNKLLEINRDRVYIDPDKVYVKPNFVFDRKTAVGKTGDKQEKRSGFIYMGRIEEIKGIKTLIGAWKLMGARAPKLVIAGTGDLEDWCRAKIERYSLNIDMRGYLDPEEVMRLVRRSTASILPTKCYEGIPMSVMESFSAGTPVIVSNIGNAEAMVTEGVNGTKFEAGSAESLKDAVIGFEGRMRNAAKMDTKIPERYRSEANYKMLIDIYEAAGSRRSFA